MSADAPASSPPVTLHIDGAVATLTINRPDARNALSIPLLESLNAVADDLTTWDSVHVLVVTGAGKAFCAGMDLKAVLGDPAAPGRLLHALADFTLKLRALPMVTVARVNGAAIGGGCGLTCVCDFAVTFADNKMGFPEVDLGVCPAVVAPWLVRKVGAGAARRILLSGGLMSGTEAHACGMVTRCVPTLDALDDAVNELTQRLASGGPHALRATKELLNQLDGSVDAGVVKRGADLSAQVIAMPETQAILRAKFAG